MFAWLRATGGCLDLLGFLELVIIKIISLASLWSPKPKQTISRHIKCLQSSGQLCSLGLLENVCVRECNFLSK